MRVPDGCEMSAEAELDRVVASIVRHLGTRALVAGADRTAELVRLVVRHWPHRRLEELCRVSRHHAGIARAGVLCRARSREWYEARHGADAWNPALSAVAGVIWECLLELWLADPWQRQAFREHSQRLAGGS